MVWKILLSAYVLLATAPVTAADSFRDCSDCPAMVRIPVANSGLEPFAIGQFEITQREWYAIMGDRPSEFVGDNLPVETISWKDAQKFVNKLSQKSGKDYRLPTAAEWEYAARAGSDAAFPFGDDALELTKYAWFIDNAAEQSHPVGQKLPNAFGLFDILGNVWEWTADCATKAQRGSANEDETVAKFVRDCHRLYRGGSFANKATSLALSHVQSSGVGDRYFALGLRVVRLLD